MAETTEQIEQYIEAKRDALGSNIQALEQKISSAADWQRQFRQRPMPLMALAFGAGVALAYLASSREAGARPGVLSAVAGTPARASWTHGPKATAVSSLDALAGALIGVAAAKVTGYIEEMIPGFKDHLNRGEQRVPGPRPFSA